MDNTATMLELRNYLEVESGHQITEMVPFDGELPDGFPRFRATLTLSGKLANGSDFSAQRPIPLDVPSLGDAFDLLRQQIPLVRAQMEAEVARRTGPQLILPGGFNGRLSG